MKLYIAKAEKNMQHNVGRELLQRIMCEEGLEGHSIRAHEKGKPYVEDTDFYFNISHSGSYVVLVTGKCELGVDIQERKPVEAEAMAKRFFTGKEYEALLASEEKEKLFYKLWTRKEAYGKWLGSGLSEQVLKTDMLELHENICFIEYTELENYEICICSGKEENIEEVISVFEGL